MLSDLFTNRLFQGGLVFFVLFVVGGLLYLSHVKRTTEKDLARTKEEIKQWETNQQQQTETHKHPSVISHKADTHADGTWHSDAHAEGTHPNADVYDWRDDSEFDVTPLKSDPWKQPSPQQETTDADDTFPPRDWYKTEDPELRAEYLYAQLIKQFGDTPEVQAIANYEKKIARDIPRTLEEYTAYLEAHYHLFPNKHNKQTLDNLRKVLASGNKIIFK